MSKTFDSIWEDEIYGKGKHLNRYPFDSVVSFVYRNYPRDRARSEVRILEIGCGAGNNLWFAAREGFAVAGIDGSQSAVEFARSRFTEENLIGDFRIGDFTDLPFEDDNFDLVIERGAIVCTGMSNGKKAVSEVRRVLKTGGRFFFNPYSKQHTSYLSGKEQDDGLITNITSGTLIGVGQLCFYDRNDIDATLQMGWQTLSLEHLEIRQMLETNASGIHAEWRVVAEKY